MKLAADPQRVVEQLQRLKRLISEVEPALRPTLLALHDVICLVGREGAPENPVFRVIEQDSTWAISRRIIDGQAAACVELAPSDPLATQLRTSALAAGLATISPDTPEHRIPVLLGAR